MSKSPFRPLPAILRDDDPYSAVSYIRERIERGEPAVSGVLVVVIDPNGEQEFTAWGEITAGDVAIAAGVMQASAVADATRGR